MKEKIIAATKAKFPGVNLSKKRLDTIATAIEKKVIDDETKIDATLDAFNEFNPIADIAKADDALRTLNAQVKDIKPTGTDKKPGDNAGKSPTTDDADDGTPAWAKTLIESNKTLHQKLSVLEGEKTASSVKGEAAKLLGEIPASYWEKRALPGDLEGVEAFVTEVQNDWKGFTKDLTSTGLKHQTPPKSGTRAGGGGTPGNGKVDPAVEAFAAKTAAKGATGISISGPVPVPGSKQTGVTLTT